MSGRNLGWGPDAKLSWSDETGAPATKDSYRLPSPAWAWLDEWAVVQEGDHEGWGYARDFTGPFSSTCVGCV